jgi:hypothetical protein
MHVETPPFASVANALILVPVALWALLSAGIGVLFREQVAMQLAITELSVLLGAGVSGLLGAVLLAVASRLRGSDGFCAPKAR